MSDKLPWCENCEAYSVPTDGECGKCGGPITYKEDE